MRTHALAVAMIALLASLAFGQTPAQPTVDRTFYFTQTRTPLEFQEASNVIRTISNSRQTSMDEAQGTFALRGTAEDIALAQWLSTQLDQSAPSQNGTPSSSEYRVAGNPDDVVRVFYRTHARTPQELVESATLVRSIANIRSLLTYNPYRAIIMCAPAAQIALADWIFADLDKHAPVPQNQHLSSAEYLATDGSDGANVVRVFYLGYAATDQDFVEAATLTRSIANLRQVFMYNALRAVAVRGNSGQVALAEWLFNQIDKPAKEQVTAEYRITENQDDLVRVFYLTKAATPQDFVKLATEIRTQAKVPQAFSYFTPRAMAVRGNYQQVALAEELSRQ